MAKPDHPVVINIRIIFMNQKLGILKHNQNHHHNNHDYNQHHKHEITIINNNVEHHHNMMHQLVPITPVKQLNLPSCQHVSYFK